MTNFKAIISMALIVLGTATAFAEGRTYQTSQGQINIDKLERVLSARLSADVSETQLRWSRNPFDVLGGQLGEYHTYVLNFTINNQYKAKCDFTLIDNDVYDTNKIMIHRCTSSPQAHIDVKGFIKPSDVDLPIQPQIPGFGLR